MPCQLSFHDMQIRIKNTKMYFQKISMVSSWTICEIVFSIASEAFKRFQHYDTILHSKALMQCLHTSRFNTASISISCQQGWLINKDESIMAETKISQAEIDIQQISYLNSPENQWGIDVCEFCLHRSAKVIVIFFLWIEAIINSHVSFIFCKVALDKSFLFDTIFIQ